LHKLIIALIAILIWSIPAHTASALWQENTEESIFLNYEQFHKTETLPTPSEVVEPTKRKVSTNDTTRYSGRDYGQGEVQDLIRKYSQQYGIEPDTPLCIAKHESGFNPNAKNKSSSASGVFQYLSSTWKGTDEGKAGYSVFDAEQNVKAAIKYMAIHKNVRPWTVHKKCPTLTFQ
jgi:soluble lytic murein transglycosylase-like protein